MKSFLVLLIGMIAMQCGSVNVIEANNIDAQHILLYDVPGASMPDQQFNITFNSSFTNVPALAYGINNLKMNDQFYYQNFTTYETGITQTEFLVNVSSVSATNIRLFSISYIAVVNEPAFHIAYQLVENGANISSGTGDRYLQLIKSDKNFSSTNVTGLTMLTGYHITSSTNFGVTTQAGLIDLSNYFINVSTYSDCKLHIVGVYAIFYEESILAASSYYYFGGSDLIFSTNSSQNSFTVNFNYEANVKIMVGLSSFGSPTSTSGYLWGWTSTAVANNTFNLTINKNSLAFISFSYLQIGMFNITSNFDPTQIKEEGISIGVIGGGVAGLIIVTIIVIIACRRCKKSENQIVPLPDQSSFKQMPSISL